MMLAQMGIISKLIETEKKTSCSLFSPSMNPLLDKSGIKMKWELICWFKSMF
jgi:hypothetical protein